MYLSSVSELRTQSKPYQLVDALIKAKQRGLKVEVVFDQNIDFEGGKLTDSELRKSKNLEAYELLRKNGIPVFFDGPSDYTHSKVVIIDGKTVILGSTNWTTTGLSRNIESNLIVRSPEVAKEALDDLKRGERQESSLFYSQNTSLSWEFQNSERLLGEMVTESDERAFDLYLALLNAYDGNAEGKVTVDYERLQGLLGLETMTREEYRRQINKTLQKIQDKYKLIELKLSYNKDAEAFLKDYADPKKTYTVPTTRYVEIPHTYWLYDWSKSMPLSAKVMYILNLAYSGASDNPPIWYTPVDTLAQRHHVSPWFISDGTMKLRRLNLLEVEYDTLEPEGGFEERLANKVSPQSAIRSQEARSHVSSVSEETWKGEIR